MKQNRLPSGEERLQRRKRWLISMLVAITTLWIFLDSYLLLTAVPYQVISNDSVRIIQGVENPGALHWLGVLFALYGIAGAVATIALHSGRTSWRELVLYSWTACFATVGLTGWHRPLELGLAVSVATDSVHSAEYQFARVAGSLPLSGLFVWLLVAGYWVLRWSSKVTLRGPERDGAGSTA